MVSVAVMIECNVALLALDSFRGNLEVQRSKRLFGMLPLVRDILITILRICGGGMA